MSIENAGDVIDALHRKYCGPEWQLFTEVPVGNEDRGARVDAMALNMWWSRGLELHGFEIKCTRADFLTEMRDPGKAETGMVNCDKWWLAVSSKDIAHPEEVPKGWGLMIPRGNSMIIKKQAIRREDVTPIETGLMLTFLKKALRLSIPDEQLVAMREEGARLGRKRGEERAEEKYKYEIEKYARLQESVDNFEKASGIKLDRWPAEGLRIGEAVETMRRIGIKGIIDRLERLKASAGSIHEDVAKKLELLEEAVSVVEKLQAQKDLFDGD